MTYSQKAVDLVKRFEGLRLQAYQDPGGVWTIGWGHTAGVHVGQKITESEADAFLQSDLSLSSEYVQEILTVPVTQSQFDALVDFDFNEGTGALGRSTLLWEINHHNPTAAADQFRFWVYARVPSGMEKLPGLVSRREAERELFLA